MTENTLSDRVGINAVTKWVIPRGVLEASFREMTADGELDREGIALWAGTRTGSNDDEVVIRHVVLLRGSSIVRKRGFIRIAPEMLNEVTDLLESVGDGAYLAAQIHGHPPHSSTDLSPTDVMYGIRTPYYLSVVAPEYGRKGHNLLADCGVHLFEPRTGWRRLTPVQRGRSIIFNSAPIEVHTVSADTEALGGWGADE